MASGTDPRIYTISTETANGRVNSKMLTAEIAAAPGVTTVLDYLDTDSAGD